MMEGAYILKYSISTRTQLMIYSRTRANTCTRRFITGGTNAGIMKYVGEARAKYDPSAPLIGVTMLSGIKGGEQLGKRLNEVSETENAYDQGRSFASGTLRNLRCLGK